mmetsp:Transcript_33385/g.54255  ORF Transcript_33385/g.54255 Transcript_33385/m.54255 type:complete len:167 (-) Transcript_33385:86-586(-)
MNYRQIMNATSSMVPFASSTGSNSSSAVSISSKAGPFNKHMQGSMLVDFTEEDDDDINEVARATEEIYDQINLLQKRERQKERELQKAEAIRGLLREDIKQAQNDIRDIKQKVAAMGMTLNRLQIEEKDLREQILAKNRNLAANRNSLTTMLSKSADEVQKFKKQK